MDDHYDTTTGAKIDPWKRIADLQAALTASEARCAELVRDAERYRWIRNAEDCDWNKLLRDSGEAMDAAIDAAMGGKT